jgi:dephospho-CoA kinase
VSQAPAIHRNSAPASASSIDPAACSAGPLVLGLTGGIASGKSTVAQMFVERGFRLIDADALARLVVEPGQPALAEIAAHYGSDVLLPDGRLDRARLGQIVFADAAERAVLNAITHPRIAEAIAARLIEYGAAPEPILLDHPLLYETGQDALVERVVVVRVSERTQLERLMARNGLTREEALARIGAQMPLEEKAARADYVVDNEGTLEQTARQVEAICRELGVGG